MGPYIVDIEISKIKFDETIYPRSEHNPSKVQEYYEHLDAIEENGNYIHISHDNRLLDGRHRHLAYLKKADDQDLTIKAYQYGQEVDSRLVAIQLNSAHGQQLTQDDKRRNCAALYAAGYTIETIQKTLSASYSFIQKATKGIRDEEKKNRQEKILKLWLACCTQTEIADAVGADRSVIAKEIETIVQNIEKDKLHKSLSNYQEAEHKPPIYNIWTFAKKTNDVSHFGNSEQRIVDNLLYLYTEPFDIVVDPFAGGGSTIDVCKKRLRRYWCSDRKPIVERESEIRKHDIAVDGIPPLNRNWSEVSLTYLDPPYWKQAENQYSSDPQDLANMSLDDFTATLAKLVKDIGKRQSKGVIALLIQPTQWKSPERQFTDHVTQLIQAVGNKNLILENRVSCPYSTEQYTPQMVDWAKQHKKLLVLSRELIVWRVTANG